MQEEIFTTRRNKDGTITVQLNGRFEIKEGDEYYEVIELLVSEINYKNSKQIFDKNLDIKFFSSLEFRLGKCKMEEEKCTICLS